eukprot:TRINITY_DN15037_c0_g1_i1.p1 TRINITY_DN15037_c0_g1~~TRINITY_DN15037_c0_g1_i1.p1  ORF type:complete len:305 (-),score=52.35 TRINITY_DN15037_c0_g1_i1:221-1135(-)
MGRASSEHFDRTRSCSSPTLKTAGVSLLSVATEPVQKERRLSIPRLQNMAPSILKIQRRNSADSGCLKKSPLAAGGDDAGCGILNRRPAVGFRRHPSMISMCSEASTSAGESAEKERVRPSSATFASYASEKVEISNPCRSQTPPCITKDRILGRATGAFCQWWLPIEKRVDFCDDGDECFESFTPYGKKYGVHPDDFYFDDNGEMVLVPDEGDTVECIAMGGVAYRTRAADAAYFPDMRGIKCGAKTLVKEKCNGWIKDKVGWLPIDMNGKSLFKVVQMEPKKKERPLTKTPSLPKKVWKEMS